MNEFKKAVLFALSLCILLVIALQLVPVENNNIGQNTVVDSIKDFILPMYLDKTSEYIVFDNSSNDITEKFISNTSDMVLKNDWNTLLAYYKEHVSFIRKIQEMDGSVPFTLDVAQHQTDFYAHTFELPYDEAAEGSYKQFSTTYYNPNTGYISSASSYIGEVRIANEYIKMSNQTSNSPVYNSAHTSARLTVMVRFEYSTSGSPAYKDYGYFTHNAIVNSQN